MKLVGPIRHDDPAFAANLVQALDMRQILLGDGRLAGGAHLAIDLERPGIGGPGLVQMLGALAMLIERNRAVPRCSDTPPRPMASVPGRGTPGPPGRRRRHGPALRKLVGLIAVDLQNLSQIVSFTSAQRNGNSTRVKTCKANWKAVMASFSRTGWPVSRSHLYSACPKRFCAPPHSWG